MAKILLCDDSDFVLTVFEKRLRQFGHQIVGKANDGVECLKMYEILSPDVVFLDISMPNKDGHETLKDLLAMDKDAKVVIISAEREEKVIKACLEMGARAY